MAQTATLDARSVRQVVEQIEDEHPGLTVVGHSASDSTRVGHTLLNLSDGTMVLLGDDASTDDAAFADVLRWQQSLGINPDEWWASEFATHFADDGSPVDAAYLVRH